MTTAEAIEALRMMAAQVGWDYPMDYSAAIDMAIDALVGADPAVSFSRGHADDDAISRHAATSLPVLPKEQRAFQTDNVDDAYVRGWHDLQGCLEGLPPVRLAEAERKCCNDDYCDLDL